MYQQWGGGVLPCCQMAQVVLEKDVGFLKVPSQTSGHHCQMAQKHSGVGGICQ
jgi:hypothetical protein